MDKMKDRIKIDISTATLLKILFIALVVWLVIVVRDIIVLFFIVLIIVAALAPIVDKMAKYMPRLVALILLSLGFVLLIGLIGYLLIPPAVNQLSHLAINLPSLASKYQPFYENIQSVIRDYQEGLINVSSQLGNLSSGIYSTTIGFLSGLVVFFTILILSFYMLLEQKTLESILLNIIPPKRKEKIVEIIQKITNKMGNWLRGQAMLMLIVGVLDGIALVSLGIPYVIVLAIWGALTEAIPYIGPWLGLIPAFFIALTISPLTALLVLVAYVAIQQIEAQFLVPKIMGKAVGLSPVIIILAVLIGAKLMGMLGVVIAIPLAAVISVLIQEWPELRKLNN